MNSLRRDLFERRLWPIAVLLVLAIVAVPFVIGGHHASASATLADDVPAVAPPPATTNTASTDKRLPKVMHRLSSTNPARDPFGASSGGSASAAAKTPASTATSSQTSSASTSTTSPSATASPSSSGAVSSSSGVTATATQTSSSTTTSPASNTTTSPSSTTTTTTTVTSPTDTATAATKSTPTPATHQYTVRVVDLYVKSPGGALALMDVARLTPLPAASFPKVMYMGTTARRTAAVFALGASVSATGPARCEPSHRDCALIALAPGRTETLTYPISGGLAKRTLELKVTRIASRQTTSKAYADAAYARHSQAGLCELQLGNPLQYQYATANGTLVAQSASACTRHGAKIPFPGSTMGSGR